MEAVKKERDKAQQYLDIAGVIFLVLDINQEVSLINKKGCKVLGHDENEIKGKNWIDNFLPERIREDVRTVFKRLAAGEIIPVEYYENPVVTRTGEERIIAWHNTVIKDGSDNIVNILSSGEDVTDRKRVEKHLHDQERFLSSIFSSIQDNLCVTDKEMNILRTNPAIEKQFAHARPLVGRKCYKAFHGRSEPCEVCPTLKTIETGASQSNIITLKNGNEIVGWFDVHSFPLTDRETGEIKGAIEYGRNITARKKAEEQLMRMEKLSSLGKMLAGIGHEIKNPLSGMGMMLRSIQNTFDQEDSRREDITRILKEIKNLETMLDNVVKFSRPRPLHLERLDITVPLENSLVLIKKALEDKAIRLEKLYDHNGMKCPIDSESMQQVFMNIFLNAIESMNINGTLSISVHDATQGQFRKPGIQVMIKDTGCGIPKKNIEKIFDPYFTTNSRKTGLGLYISHQIISAHKGTIDVTSSEGLGSTFSICLPEQQPLSMSELI